MITKNEVRKRLSKFSKTFENSQNEKSQANIFITRFYECFNIAAESSTLFEKKVKTINGNNGFIDSFIPSLLVIEMKSRGKCLDSAFIQASNYALGLNEKERPKYIITSDFSRFRIFDLVNKTEHECELKELSQKADWFNFLIERNVQVIQEETEIDRNAAYLISELHQSLLETRYISHDLEVFMTRLLFCFFADDTGIFGENKLFEKLVKNTNQDGSDLGARISQLFQVLDQDKNKRQTTLNEILASFNYINGSLFSEKISIPDFNSDLRENLIKCSELNWSNISPAIFGAMFQGVLEQYKPDKKRTSSRRELGAHYTSERNILRVIEPLFLNDLRNEFENYKSNKKKLHELHIKLSKLNFFDPACGCGNFLVIAYRELRRLENEIIMNLYFNEHGTGGLLDVSAHCLVKVNQFYGIEIDESAVHIARVAMWITDHQMNLESSKLFGTTRPTVPIVDSPTIVCANSLRLNWENIIKPENCSFVMGNQPFVGKSYQTKEQKEDLLTVCKDKNCGVLDYVCAWYIKAAEYIQDTLIKVAFVSTNSITQGEQVSILWKYLQKKNIYIHFAHRTFQWNNEGKGVAAVHCIIIGFSTIKSNNPFLFDYPDGIKNEPQKIKCKNINGYLIDAPNIYPEKRKKPLCKVPEMIYGSMPNDGGFLLFSEQEKQDFLLLEPKAIKFFKRFMMGEEFINNIKRWCLWLNEVSPSEWRSLPEVYKRVQSVKKQRLASNRESTKNLANTPYLFGEIRHKNKSYLALPRVSSENRNFIPIGFLDENIIAGDKLYVILDATLYHFAILTSTMHMAWTRVVCGRLKSDYSYSNTIVYNNFPFPENPEKKKLDIVNKAALAILDARALYPNSSLSDLYDSSSMPVELVNKHQTVDKIVDDIYGYKGKKDDASRVTFLFKLYEELLLRDSKL